MATRENTKLTKFVCVLLALLFVTLTTRINATLQSGCVLRDKSRTALFISYDGLSFSPLGVRLRLHNNTNCSVIVETNDRELNLAEDGKSRVLLLHYLIQDRRRQTLKPAYGWGDSVFTYEISEGYSATFVVPSALVKKSFDVAVPFVYTWQGKYVGAGFTGGVKQYVYFLADDFPKNANRKAK